MGCLRLKGLLPVFPPPPSFLFIAGFETICEFLLSEAERRRGLLWHSVVSLSFYLH